MGKKVKLSLIVCALTAALASTAAFVADHGNQAEEAVQVVSERVLVPGGQSVGIRMNVKGVLVVGLEEIETEEEVVSPGYNAGLQTGDMILSINDIPVYYASDVAELVNSEKTLLSGSKLKLRVQRKDDQMDIYVTPVRDIETGEIKIGVWVKEKIAGIGTLTFFDPQTNMFASLGHGIYENQTGTLLEAGEGQLLRTEVRSIKEGEAGNPGEIRGIFYENDQPVGTVLSNSVFGIYSRADDFRDFELAQPMVMGRQDQVETGDAYILTTIDGDKVQRFDIRITKINRQNEPAPKGMEIEVTDEDLLDYSGGIVQGMSGSPIIQNNRIVGAVTHVLVNNPTKGYGIFAEWMVEECEKNS